MKSDLDVTKLHRLMEIAYSNVYRNYKELIDALRPMVKKNTIGNEKMNGHIDFFTNYEETMNNYGKSLAIKEK